MGLDNPSNDTELPAAALLASASAVPTTSQVGAVLQAYNGSTVDLLQVDALKNLLVSLRGTNGTVFVAAISDAETNAVNSLSTSSRNQTFDGTTWNRLTGNTSNSALASGARTAATPSVGKINYNSRGVQAILNVTAVPVSIGSDSLTLQIFGVSSIGTNYQLNANPTPVVAIGKYVYELYPNASGASGDVVQRTSGVLPHNFLFNVAVGGSQSFTYSVMYELIV